MRYYLVLLLSFLSFANLDSRNLQEKSYTYIVNSSNNIQKITLDGYVDGQNSKSWNRWFIQKTFEPMKSIQIKNIGNSSINNPKIFINNKKKWFSITDLCSEIFAADNYENEKTYSLFHTVINNRIHNSYPQRGSEGKDPVKYLSIYGYGWCDYSASVIGAIAQHDYFARKWALGGHAVTEVDFGNGYKLLDCQAECFYLDYDNQTIIDKQTATNDKYLMHRTHHGGKTYLNSNNYIDLYDIEDETISDYSSGHNLDFVLKPGCTFEYNWETPKYYHHLHTQPIEHMLPIIANNHFYYNIPFSRQSANSIFLNSQNIITSNSSQTEYSVQLKEDSSSGYFIIQIESPFPILNSDIIIDSKICDACSINIDFARNYGDWQFVKQFDNQSKDKSISLYDFFDPLSQNAYYKYFLRFTLFDNSKYSKFGINNLQINSTVQSSKFFMPELELGENTVTFQADNNNIGAEIKVEWLENYQNHPPQQIIKPIYPPDNTEIDSMQFTFIWEEPNDYEDDEIVDYNFELSHRDDMKYPLSSNFSWYISTFEGDLLPQFTIPNFGLLNPNQEYYWHIRSKDSNGFWSEWSPIFSFVPNGPKQVTGIKIFDGFIQWNKNNNSEITYIVYGSNIENGFIPNSENIISKTEQCFFDVSESEYKFFRIVAEKKNGNKSIPSPVIIH